MTMQRPRFSPGLSQVELQRGYEKIGNRAPFTKDDIKKAYQPYSLKLNKSRGGRNDSALYREATKAVLGWYRKQEAEKAKAEAAAKKAAAAAAAGPATGGAPGLARATGGTAATVSPRAVAAPVAPVAIAPKPAANPLVAGAGAGILAGTLMGGTRQTRKRRRASGSGSGGAYAL